MYNTSSQEAKPYVSRNRCGFYLQKKSSPKPHNQTHCNPLFLHLPMEPSTSFTMPTIAILVHLPNIFNNVQRSFSNITLNHLQHLIAENASIHDQPDDQISDSHNCEANLTSYAHNRVSKLIGPESHDFLTWKVSLVCTYLESKSTSEL